MATKPMFMAGKPGAKAPAFKPCAGCKAPAKCKSAGKCMAKGK